MRFKILLSLIVLFLLSCDNTQTGLTIVHFKVINQETTEPIENIPIVVNMFHQEFEGDSYSNSVLTDSTDVQGEVDLAFFNTSNNCQGYVPLGLSGYTEGRKIKPATENTIEFSITPPQELVEFHIDSIIDSIYLHGIPYNNFGTFEEVEYLIKINNDTIIKRKILPFDTVQLNLTYFIQDSVIYQTDTIEVGDEVIQHYIP